MAIMCDMRFGRIDVIGRVSCVFFVACLGRRDFQQRVSNNPAVDYVRSYQIGNITTSVGFSDDLEVDFMLLNVTDEAGVNSSMTDVFGVAATGLELIPPRQFMTRIRYSF